MSSDPPADDPGRLERLAHARRSRPGEQRDGAGRQQVGGVHSRGYLPHVKVEGGIYFVTFRLADAMPRTAGQRIKEEIAQEVIRARERWLLRHPPQEGDEPPAFDENHAVQRAKFAIMDRWPLSKLLHSWKSWTAKEAAKLIGGECPARFWMPESYDHWCRDTGEVDRCVRYTLMNPVKAGLSATPQDYPWCGPYP